MKKSAQERFWDTQAGMQVAVQSPHSISSTDSRVEQFFKPLPEGHQFSVVESDGKKWPLISKIPPASAEQNKAQVAALLMQLVDSKQAKVFNFVLGYKSTPPQIERYKDKYERAKLGEFPSEKNTAVIQKFEAMRDTARGFTDMIEFFRESVSDLIEQGELDKAELAIKSGQDFGAETKIDDVKSFLSGL